MRLIDAEGLHSSLKHMEAECIEKAREWGDLRGDAGSDATKAAASTLEMMLVNLGGALSYVAERVEETPTVEADRTLHSAWVKCDDPGRDGLAEHICLNCRMSEWFSPDEERYRYCPHCGARMDLPADDIPASVLKHCMGE